MELQIVWIVQHPHRFEYHAPRNEYIAILFDEQTKIPQNQRRGECPCDPY